MLRGIQKILVACGGGVKKVWRQKFSIAQPPPPKYLWTLPYRSQSMLSKSTRFLYGSTASCRSIQCCTYVYTASRSVGIIISRGQHTRFNHFNRLRMQFTIINAKYDWKVSLVCDLTMSKVARNNHAARHCDVRLYMQSQLGHKT